MRKNILLVSALLGTIVFLSGCGDDEKKKDTIKASVLVPARKLPAKGIIGVVPLTTGDPQVPRGLSFIDGEDALIVTAEGPVKSDRGTIYMAPKRDKDFSIRTSRKTSPTLNFAKFSGHFYDTRTNALYVCGNHKNPATPPQVLVLLRQNDGRFLLADAMDLDTRQAAGVRCGGVTVVGDYIFASNQTPTSPNDTAIFAAKISNPLPDKMDSVLTYADLSVKAQEISKYSHMITDIKPKITQSPDRFSIWILLSKLKKIVGVDFGLYATRIVLVGTPKVLSPGNSLNFLQSMVPYTDEFFIILDNNKLYSSRFDATGKLIKTKLLLENLMDRSVLSMYLGKDRFKATSFPVLFYLPSPPGEPVSLVTEFAFDPNET
ncbi:hypothetical protein [Candidatus Ichthyocystis hellenicum]|uniref:hypothetical protein n=1 Tax=Candidatus Ichthyocystis hellenicum TaxID=1561003 RepID=UPI000B826498|nr:hypothetical protein [Candidatus Ichthyocystis hellenicum]